MVVALGGGRFEEDDEGEEIILQVKRPDELKTVSSVSTAAPPGEPTACISPSLLRKEQNVMPVEIDLITGDAEGPAGHKDQDASAVVINAISEEEGEEPSSSMDGSAVPYAEGTAAGGGGKEGGGPRATVRFAAGAGSDENKAPATNPAFSHSYHVRQLAFCVAKRYSRLYTKEEARRVEREYRVILSRHNDNTAIRKLHKTIGERMDSLPVLTC